MATTPWESARHDFVPNKNDIKDSLCAGGWYNDRDNWINCRAAKHSVMHFDPVTDHRLNYHDDDSDCYCFEGDND